MYFSCTKAQLLDSINTVQRAASFKLSLEVLKGIKIEVKDGIVTFSATDLEIGIQTKQSLIDTENGVCVVPAKLFADIAKKLPSTSTITCTTQKNVLQIAYKGSNIEITTINADDFPMMPEIEAEPIKISSTVLKKALSQVKVAVSIEQARPIFTGVLFNLDKETFELVGTDTHRLALVEMTLERNKNSFKTIIPANAVEELIKLPDGLTIGIKQKGGQLVFETEDTKIFARSIEGTFPNYRQIIPTKWVSRISVDRKELTGVIERASILSSNNVVTVVDGLRIESRNSIGSINEVYEAPTEGEPIKIAFNPLFMISALKSMSSETVKIEFNGPTSPIVLREDGHIHLVLPVRSS
jgi:DNA polymerase III, beta subunit